MHLEVKKSIAAYTVFVLGCIMLVLGGIFDQLIISPFDIKKDVIKWTSFFVGAVFLFSGITGISRKSLNDAHMKKLDLIWIMFGAFGAYLVFINVSAKQVEDYWDSFFDNSTKFKAEVVNNLEESRKAICPPKGIPPIQYDYFCQTLFRELAHLSVEHNWPVETRKIMEAGNLPSEAVNNLRRPLEYIEGTIGFYDKTWYKPYRENGEYASNFFKLFVMIAAALRLSKSVTEVFWLPIKKDKIINRSMTLKVMPLRSIFSAQANRPAVIPSFLSRRRSGNSR